MACEENLKTKERPFLSIKNRLYNAIEILNKEIVVLESAVEPILNNWPQEKAPEDKQEMADSEMMQLFVDIVYNLGAAAKRISFISKRSIL